MHPTVHGVGCFPGQWKREGTRVGRLSDETGSANRAAKLLPLTNAQLSCYDGTVGAGYFSNGENVGVVFRKLGN